jgi:hypothetical protein
MGTKKKFTSRFSFMQKDEIHSLDQTWDQGDDGDESVFWNKPLDSAPASAIERRRKK